MENKDKLSNLVSELREILEKANWGVAVTNFENKPLVGDRGEVVSTKSIATISLSVGDKAKSVHITKK